MHLEAKNKIAMYTSITIQNQVIDIIGNMIREKITAYIKETDAFFSIIADEVTEKHLNKEIISFCLRFVLWKSDKPVIRVVFFDFCYLSRTTGVAITDAIKESLRTRGVDITKAKCQAYDSASAMPSNSWCSSSNS